jgi:hypothetical protein
LAHSLFAGKYSEDATSDDEDGRNDVSLHTFAKICRGAASTIQEILHQDPKFYDFSPPDGEPLDEFGKAVEKLHRHRVDQLKLPAHTYKFVLAGAIAGLAVNKLRVVPRLEDTEEYLLSILDRETAAEKSGMSSEVERTEVSVSDDLVNSIFEPGATDELSLSSLLSGGLEAKASKRSKKGTKRLKYDLAISLVNPANYFWDPLVTNIKESAWCAERYWVPMYKLDPLFKSGFLKNKKELIDAIGEGSRASTTSSQGENFEYQNYLYQDQHYKPNEYCPLVEVIEYYGPLLKKGTGEVLKESQRVIIGNGKVILKSGDITDWKRRPPYFASIMSEVPFKAIGAGVADSGIDNELIANRIMSLALDQLAFTVHGVSGIKVDDLEDPEQVEQGFHPGMILKFRNSATAAKDAFFQIDHNPQNTFPILQMIEKLELAANASAGVDVTTANPSSRARISASEVQANTDRSSKSQYTLGRELDDTYLEETLIRVLDFVLQYDLENAALREAAEAGLLTEAEVALIEGIPKNERIREAKRKYRLSVKGFRERLQKNEFLSRLSEFMQQINFLIQTNPAVSQMIDYKYLLKAFSEAYGVNTDKMIVNSNPADRAREENTFLEEDRMVEVFQQDEHAAHLPQHYEQLFRNQNEATVTHVREHLMVAMQNQVNVPPPPPELVGFIFPEMQQQQEQPGGQPQVEGPPQEGPVMQ